MAFNKKGFAASATKICFMVGSILLFMTLWSFYTGFDMIKNSYILHSKAARISDMLHTLRSCTGNCEITYSPHRTQPEKCKISIVGDKVKVTSEDGLSGEARLLQQYGSFEWACNQTVIMQWKEGAFEVRLE